MYAPRSVPTEQPLWAWLSPPSHPATTSSRLTSAVSVAVDRIIAPPSDRLIGAGAARYRSQAAGANPRRLTSLEGSRRLRIVGQGLGSGDRRPRVFVRAQVAVHFQVGDEIRQRFEVAAGRRRKEAARDRRGGV